MTGHQRAAAVKRWEEWIPKVYMESRKHADPKLFREFAHTLHLRRLVALRTRNISMRTIRTHNLDSPFETEETFSDALCDAVARRTPRLGRVKGIRRTQEEIHHAS